MSVATLRIARPRRASAPPTASPQSSTHNPRRKISVMTIHVFMHLSSMIHCPYRPLSRIFLSRFAGPRNRRFPGKSSSFRTNPDITIENGCFSVVAFAAGGRGERARALSALIRRTRPCGEIFCGGPIFFRRECGGMGHLLRSSKTTASRRRMSAPAPNGSSKATASWASVRSSSRAFSMPTTAG